MKSQKHNEGDLKDLTVKIEKEVVESIERMSSVSGITVDEIVVVALKRFRSSHADYEGKVPTID
ncbi:MAG: hypothetical protein KC493_10015 [Bacteriovoracaceae bacterium]|nr:hypothetical protein [Bacteriovoracaceae bacterium]